MKVSPRPGLLGLPLISLSKRLLPPFPAARVVATEETQDVWHEHSRQVWLEDARFAGWARFRYFKRDTWSPSIASLGRLCSIVSLPLRAIRWHDPRCNKRQLGSIEKAESESQGVGGLSKAH